MQNLNPNSAQVASAPLITETVRPQPAAPVAAAPAVQRAESLSTGEQVKLDTYKVKRGDTLWDIAGVKLGDSKKWPLLFALNKDQIKNPDLIYPGQVLTIPQKVEVAPPAPPTAIPSPVDPTPPPVQEEPVPVPAQPSPAQPAPVQEVPAAPPVVAQPPVLKPPSELPEPAPDPVPATPAPVQEEPVAPVAPVQTAPPVEPVAPLPPGAVIGQPPVAENKGNGVGKAALIGGTVATVATGAVLIGVTRSLAPPLSNLGGYATAQVVAKSVNGVIGKVGLHVPAGPALAKIVSKVGGPKVAGAVTALAVGAVVAGVAAGGYYLYNKATQKDTPAAQPPQVPTKAPSPSGPAPTTPTNAAEAATGSADNPQPVANDVSAARAELMKKLDANLAQKSYFGYGSVVNTQETAQISEQLWVGATEISHRLDVAKALVNNGMATELGRIMGNSGVSDLEVAQLMAQPSFPTKEFMAGIDDNKATLVLISLSNVSAMGEPETSRLLKEIATSFDGRFKDRETPFVRLKSHHETMGTWNQVPADVRSQIEALIK
jgi:nucleoid-associated protein YgaU